MSKRRRRRQKKRKSSACDNTRRRPWRGDPYWQYELTGILLEFGATALPDLSFTNDDAGKRARKATQVRRKYVVRRIRALRKEYDGPLLNERVHDFLDQARLQTDGAYWREVDQEYHKRNVFML